ncbi:MAG: EAL domain-containing protein [Desulfobulbaceae bacterium]|nr:EAL domain-containing protein [Desulfobulbaceae bacterium]
MKITSDLLQAAYAVCRFLLQERDLANLLQGICDRLTVDGRNPSALLVLRDQDAGGVITAETGLGDRFALIMDRLREGQLPNCGTLALQAGDGETVLCERCDCGVCIDSGGPEVSSAICAAIRCSPSLSGFFTIQLPPGTQATALERRIIADLAVSITQALRQLFDDEAAKQREVELQLVEERYELALHASQAGLWDWNIKTGEMYTSPDQWKFLDYRSGNGDSADAQRVIHPDDRDRVLTVLNEHLTGKTEEYRIEYRVQDKGGEWIWFLDRGRVVERDENNMPVRMTGTHQNITLQKKQDQALAAVQQQLHEAVDHERSFLQTVIDSAGDPVMVIDLDFNLLLINQAAAGLVRNGGDIASMQGQKCYRLFCGSDSPCQDRRFPCPVTEVGETLLQTKLIHNPYHGNGVNNTFELEVSPLRDSQGGLYGIIEVARDITDRLRIEKELRESQSYLYRLAHHDTLTGLPNRLLFRDRLTQAINKAGRNRTNVAILFLDLDRFKVINDSLGHDIGDLLLIEVAARLQRQCRQSDTVARLGGDEFVFILENIGSREDASVVATKIMSALTVPVLAQDNELTITTSIGIALFPDDSNEIEGVLKCADLALYAAKDFGRSNFQFFRKDIPQGGQRPRLDEQQFRRAIALGQLLLDYLPEYELSTGHLVGLASKLTWNHPEMGVLQPETFIPAATECGMLAGVGEWLLLEVCRSLQGWRQEGKRLLPVTVPLISRQLLDPDFLPMIERVLAQYEISPALLILELRENAVTDATAQGLECIEQIGRLGLGLAVGDFGTDRCALSRLQQLPFGRIALNREVLGGVLADRKAATLATAIIGLGHALGLTVLAEGVEEESQLAFLRRHGCDQVQGPLWSPALGRELVLSLLPGSETGG